MTKRMTNDQLMTQFPNSQGRGRDYGEGAEDAERMRGIEGFVNAFLEVGHWDLIGHSCLEIGHSSAAE